MRLVSNTHKGWVLGQHNQPCPGPRQTVSVIEAIASRSKRLQGLNSKSARSGPALLAKVVPPAKTIGFSGFFWCSACLLVGLPSQSLHQECLSLDPVKAAPVDVMFCLTTAQKERRSSKPVPVWVRKCTCSWQFAGPAL